MEEQGYVYILTNDSFRENWVKIGMSSRPVEQRIKELDTTAIPLPFKIYATMKTAKYVKAEQHVHKFIDRFTQRRIRGGREFFNITPEEALDIFRDVAEILDDAEIKVYKHNDCVTSTPAPTTPAPAKEIAKQPASIAKKLPGSSAWYFPCNPRYYRIHDVVKEVGYSYWHQGNHRYNIGDVLYLYISGGESVIRYKAIVTNINLNEILPGEVNTDIYETEDDQTDQSRKNFMRIQYVGIARSEKLTREYLLSLGHKGFMSPNHFSSAIVAKLEEEF